MEVASGLTLEMDVKCFWHPCPDCGYMTQPFSNAYRAGLNTDLPVDFWRCTNCTWLGHMPEEMEPYPPKIGTREAG